LFALAWAIVQVLAYFETALVSCVLLQQVEENLLMLRIMQGSINMNPVIMFLALLVGARATTAKRDKRNCVPFCIF
jgi:predicted PurR-regulated permease PerM